MTFAILVEHMDKASLWMFVSVKQSLSASPLQSVNNQLAKKLPDSLWKPRVRCLVYNSPQLVRIIEQIYLIYIQLFFILILFFHLRPDTQRSIFP